MTKEETELHETMKTMITDKTDCMINSYQDVLNKTRTMIDFVLGDDTTTEEEILKRADMFWNIALQRIDKEEQQRQQQEYAMMQQQNQQHMPPQNMPQGMPPQGESPCAKKSREAAEKIAVLEAKIVENKK